MPIQINPRRMPLEASDSRVDEASSMAETLSAADDRLRVARDLFSRHQPAAVPTPPAAVAPAGATLATFKVMAGVTAPVRVGEPAVVAAAKPAATASDATLEVIRKDGWLYLSDPADQALYRRLVPTHFELPPDGIAGLTNPVRVEDPKLSELDKLYQLPTSFASLDEARRWTPRSPDSEDGPRIDFSGPPFKGLDELSPEEQQRVLTDPRRAYAQKLGLLDGTLPPLPVPLDDQRPHAWLYTTDARQQALVKSRVPMLTMYDDAESGMAQSLGVARGSQKYDEASLAVLDRLYAQPLKFASLDAAMAWRPTEKQASRPDDGDALHDQVTLRTQSPPWEHLSMLPVEVQRKVLENPRLAFAGLNGLVSGAVPEGYAPMRSDVTPSGRYVSFEERFGGYSPEWASKARWVDGVGIVLPKEAVFVPHHWKPDLISDIVLPTVAMAAGGWMMGAGAAGLGETLGALAQGVDVSNAMAMGSQVAQGAMMGFGAASFEASVARGAMGGLTSAITSDSENLWRGALTGALGAGLNPLTSELTSKLGHSLSGVLGGGGDLLSEAVRGGVSSRVSGGRFADGFLSGLFDGATGANGLDLAGRVSELLGGSNVARLVARGAVSALGPGATAEGTVRAVFDAAIDMARRPGAEPTPPGEQEVAAAHDAAVAAGHATFWVDGEPYAVADEDPRALTAEPGRQAFLQRASLAEQAQVARELTLGAEIKGNFEPLYAGESVDDRLAGYLGVAADFGGVATSVRFEDEPAVELATSTGATRRADDRLFGDGIAFNDLTQGRFVADCGVISALNALGGARPDLIEDAIEPLPDGTYRVRLFADPDDLREKSYWIIDPEYLDGTRGVPNDPKKIWGVVLEAALGGEIEGNRAVVDRLDGFFNPADVLFAVTGRRPNVSKLDELSTNELWNEMKSYFVDHRSPMTAWTYKTTDVETPDVLRLDHAYVVRGVYEQDGRRYVELHNGHHRADRPGGYLFSIPVETFHQFFTGIGALPG